MEFANALDGVVLVLVILAQVDAKVRMVPVGISVVHLALPALGAATRGVALEPQAHAIDDGGLATLDIGELARHDILLGVRIGVVVA